VLFPADVHLAGVSPVSGLTWSAASVSVTGMEAMSGANPVAGLEDAGAGCGLIGGRSQK